MDYRAKVAKQSGEREADTRLSVISAMLSWAVANSHLRANNVAGFKRIYYSDRAELIWKPEDVAAFMAVAPLELQRAMILALHTGQRQGDLLKLAWTNYDGQVITLRQGKSRRRGVAGPVIVIPCTQALKRMLDAMPRTATTILTSKTRAPFKRRHFCKLWIDAARAAGIEGLHMHDVRGTSVTLLSEAGANHQQIAAITGHSLRSVATILDRYLARTRGLAEQAIFHFENSPRTDFASRLQTGPSGQITREQKSEEICQKCHQ
jgi:integrase